MGKRYDALLDWMGKGSDSLRFAKLLAGAASVAGLVSSLSLFKDNLEGPKPEESTGCKVEWNASYGCEEPPYGDMEGIIVPKKSDLYAAPKKYKVDWKGAAEGADSSPTEKGNVAHLEGSTLEI